MRDEDLAAMLDLPDDYDWDTQPLPARIVRAESWALSRLKRYLSALMDWTEELALPATNHHPELRRMAVSYTLYDLTSGRTGPGLEHPKILRDKKDADDYLEAVAKGKLPMLEGVPLLQDPAGDDLPRQNVVIVKRRSTRRRDFE